MMQYDVEYNIFFVNDLNNESEKKENKNTKRILRNTNALRHEYDLPKQTRLILNFRRIHETNLRSQQF